MLLFFCSTRCVLMCPYVAYSSMLTLIKTIWWMYVFVRRSLQCNSNLNLPWVFWHTINIILRSDSRSKVEISGPICLSSHCQVTYRLMHSKSLTFFIQERRATGFNVDCCVLKSFLRKDSWDEHWTLVVSCSNVIPDCPWDKVWESLSWRG